MWAKAKWYLLGGIVGLAALFVWTRSPGTTVVAADLVDRFPQAVQTRPNAQVFTLGNVTVAGRALKSIAVSQASRIVWKETIPSHAWLDVSLALREEAWSKDGDGVLFMVGITAAGKYDELLSLVVNPFGNPADRQWYPLMLDLSPYAGQEVEIIFNTRAGPGESGTAENDLAVWGAPAIVTR